MTLLARTALSHLHEVQRFRPAERLMLHAEYHIAALSTSVDK